MVPMWMLLGAVAPALPLALRLGRRTKTGVQPANGTRVARSNKPDMCPPIHPDRRLSRPCPPTGREEEGPHCRVCWEPADRRREGRLVQPCACSGTQAHVHVRCLRRCQEVAASRTHCPTCRQQYSVQLVRPQPEPRQAATRVRRCYCRAALSSTLPLALNAYHSCVHFSPTPSLKSQTQAGGLHQLFAADAAMRHDFLAPPPAPAGLRPPAGFR